MTLVLLFNASSETGGSYVISFPPLTPSERNDSVAWSAVLIEEAADPGGEWLEIGTTNLEPLDSDPAKPEARAITVIGATLAVGWYRATFSNSLGDLEPTRPIRRSRSYTAPDSITPTVADVSSLLYDMLVEEGGQVATAFGDSTSPTASQAEFFITQAVVEVLGRLQVDIPAIPTAINLGKWVATIHAARLIVRFFNTERSDDSASTASLDKMFDATWPDLVQACRAPTALRLV